VALVVYNKSTLDLLFEMQKFHKLAFESHFKPLVALFVATEMSFLTIWGAQAY